METEQEKFYRTANFATAPIRALDYIWQALGMLVLGGIVFMVFIYNSVAWVVDAGAYSASARSEQAWGMRSNAVDLVDLGSRETRYGDAGEDVQLILGIYTDAPYKPSGPPTSFNELDSRFCNLYGGDLTTAPGPWLERDKDWWKRKAHRMEKDLITGESNTAALRYTLTALHLGVTPEDHSRSALYPDPGASAYQVSESTTFCNADISGRTAEQTAQWRNASIQINLSGAPAVVYGPNFWGICLKSANCQPSDLSPYVTKYDDLFADDPPLSAKQMDAEKALLETGSPDFWVRMAHQNHVFGHDEEIRGYAERQRIDLAVQLATKPLGK